MASFETAYNKYIKPNEGGYSNVGADKGGETYGGIARNFWPSWIGWPQIDAVKAKTGTIKRGTIFPYLEDETELFYRNWWNAHRFGEIKSQDVANLLFDYNINSDSLAITAVQRLVGVPADGGMGPITIAAINKADPTKLYNDLLKQRKGLYEKIVQRDPTQKVFWDGWMNRLASFPALVTPKNTIIVLIGLAAAVWIGYELYTSSKAVAG